jgi:hypothetical protein
MPRLSSLIVCEKIIQDQLGKPTLISLFQSLSATVPDGQEMPKEAVASTSWAIFCEWFFTNDEQSKIFDQVNEVLLPDGSPSPVKGRVTIKQMAPLGQGTRVFVNIVGLPVWQAGVLTVKVWLECDSEKMTDVFSYPIKIEHTSKPPEPNDGGSFIHAFVPGSKA